jgi:hypothetical protein
MGLCTGRKKEVNPGSFSPDGRGEILQGEKSGNHFELRLDLGARKIPGQAKGEEEKEKKD